MGARTMGRDRDGPAGRSVSAGGHNHLIGDIKGEHWEWIAVESSFFGENCQKRVLRFFKLTNPSPRGNGVAQLRAFGAVYEKITAATRLASSVEPENTYRWALV